MARAGEWRSLTSLRHSTERAATVASYGAARAASRCAQAGKAMRPFPPAAPFSATDRFLGFNNFKSHHSTGVIGKAATLFAQFDYYENPTGDLHPAHVLPRNGVTGACLPPLMVWLARAVKVVHAAAYASRRGSTVDCAPFAGGGLLGRHARNLHSWSRGWNQIARTRTISVPSVLSALALRRGL